MRVPITVITGYLGSGKTTLLRRFLEEADERLAIVMNEFGEIGIDGKIIKGKNVNMVELSGGCVCCSLAGEFEAAAKEIIATVKPDSIVLETTGLAEPEALIADIQENIMELRLDSVVTIVDCYAMVKFPSLGYTGRIQIEYGDFILLNKSDLVSSDEIKVVEEKVRSINTSAILFQTVHCNIDTRLLKSPRVARPPVSKHEPHEAYFQSFYLPIEKIMEREKFEEFLSKLPEDIFRAKGFVKFPEGTFLVNYVAGRYDFEEAVAEESLMVFIGRNIERFREKMASELKAVSAER